MKSVFTAGNALHDLNDGTSPLRPMPHDFKQSGSNRHNPHSRRRIIRLVLSRIILNDLSLQGCQILANVTSADYTRIIKILEEAILSTDLAVYFGSDPIHYLLPVLVFHQFSIRRSISMTSFMSCLMVQLKCIHIHCCCFSSITFIGYYLRQRMLT